MKRIQQFFWATAALLAAAALVSVVAPPAVAQIRAALVRDVDSPIRGVRHIEPFVDTLSTGDFSDSILVTPAIPAGKKLFIQSVSVHLLLTDGQSPMSMTFRGPDDSELWLDMDLQASSSTANPQRHFVGNRDVNMLLSPGDQVRVFVFRNGDEGNAALNFYEGTIVGYFVDAS
jgi:hypothetical protein